MVRFSSMLFAGALFACASAAAHAQAYPTYGPRPAATVSPDPALLARAKKVFAQLQAGKLDPSELATSGPNGNMSEATIANAQKMVGGLGAPVSFVTQQSNAQGGVSAAIYVLTFKNGKKIDFLFAVNSQGKVAGMSLGTPH